MKKARKNHKPRVVTIQIAMTENYIKELDEMATEAGITTRKDLINNALTLLFWTKNQIQEGRIIVSLDEKSETYSELQMPFMQKLKANNS